MSPELLDIPIPGSSDKKFYLIFSRSMIQKKKIYQMGKPETMMMLQEKKEENHLILKTNDAHFVKEHDYCIPIKEAKCFEYTKKDYVTRKFAKCESCRKSRTKVLLPKSVVHFTTSKSDGKTCDFCGDVMTSTLPDLLPNRFEGRRGSRGDLNQGKLSTYLYNIFVECR